VKPATLEEVELIVAERLADLERRIAPEALTVRDVCRRLRLGTSRVNELIRTGALPSYKIGGSRRIDPAALAAFLAERQRRATSSEPPHASKAVTVTNWLADLQREAYGG
jgi:excisionase family DNA binding protein